MPKTVLVTGGCGFIGHHFVEHIFVKTDWNIIVLDKLTYASHGLERLRNTDTLDSKRVKVFTYDLSHPLSIGLKKELGDVNYIVHMAADTHVDNSISTPVPFIKNNIMSSVHMLEYARTLSNLEIFFYFSTDEVYGPALGNKLFQEDERHNPTNPYSASKSGAEQICVAYHNTYDVPVMRINVMNAMGERQHVEKFIPKVIQKVLNDELVEIHSYPDKKTSGTRYYIHARNIAAGVLFLLENGTIGESYNLTGEKEVSNLEMAQIIADTIGKPLNYEMVDFHSDRPGHDLRYGLDGNKMKKMGWSLPIDFETSLRNTVKWTVDNQIWLNE
jgi:dTDP-glucose 4,6-dehydratase